MSCNKTEIFICKKQHCDSNPRCLACCASPITDTLPLILYSGRRLTIYYSTPVSAAKEVQERLAVGNNGFCRSNPSDPRRLSATRWWCEWRRDYWANGLLFSSLDGWNDWIHLRRNEQLFGTRHFNIRNESSTRCVYSNIFIPVYILIRHAYLYIVHLYVMICILIDLQIQLAYRAYAWAIY